MKFERMEEKKPCVAISLLSEGKHFAKEMRHTFPLEELPLSKRGGFCAQSAYGNNRHSLSILLLRKEPAPSGEGWLLDMDVVHNSEVFPLTNISWDGKEQKVVAAGKGWMVYLSDTHETLR
ncbi:MAG: hypothetical protein ACI4SG_09235 [Oligosphaeraceae bacterium]